MSRPSCSRCRRPIRVCVCAALVPVESRTRVVFLQHPREARMPVSTCRLAHLSLPNSELHVGLGPEGDARLESIAKEPGTMLLFPGPDATDVRDLRAPPSTLIVVDGTWINARKLVVRSPLVAALPRIGFTPLHPSNYRIRREPAPHCVSTIEAVVHVLDALDERPGRFTPILGVFDRMVELQLTFIESGTTAAPARPRHLSRGSPLAAFRTLGDRLVLVSAAGYRQQSGIRWVARRFGTGESIDSDNAAGWSRFSRPDDVCGGWGGYAGEVLRDEGLEVGAWLDLKRFATGVLRRPVHGVERLGELAGAVLPPQRPLRELVAAEAVVRGLLAGALSAAPRSAANGA